MGIGGPDQELGRLDIALTVTIRDLLMSDLGSVSAFSSPSHDLSVKEHLERVATGEVRYFAAALPSGVVVGKACLDFRGERAPQVTKASVHGLFQNLGIGAALLAACEDEARRRGCEAIHLGVDDRDPRPIHLYRRAGFEVTGTGPESWTEVDPDGTTRHVTITAILMTKRLDPED